MRDVPTSASSSAMRVRFDTTRAAVKYAGPMPSEIFQRSVKQKVQNEFDPTTSRTMKIKFLGGVFCGDVVGGCVAVAKVAAAVVVEVATVVTLATSDDNIVITKSVFADVVAVAPFVVVGVTDVVAAAVDDRIVVDSSLAPLAAALLTKTTLTNNAITTRPNAAIDNRLFIGVLSDNRTLNEII